MKFTIEGRQTVLDVVEANDLMEALKKFHAKYPAANIIVDVREGSKPSKKTCTHTMDKPESDSTRTGRLLMGGTRIKVKYETLYCPDCGERLRA